MSTLLEIEAAAEALAQEQKAELVRVLSAQLRPPGSQARRARVVRNADDILLEAPPGAPVMSAENVKRMLQDWP